MKSKYIICSFMIQSKKQILTREQLEYLKFNRNNIHEANAPFSEKFLYREKYFKNPEESQQETISKSSEQQLKVQPQEKQTSKRSRSYKLYTVTRERDDVFREQVQKQQKQQRRLMLENSRGLLPEIKTVKYLIKKKYINAEQKQKNNQFNYMNPTANSIFAKKKSLKKPNERLLCSVHCRDHYHYSKKNKYQSQKLLDNSWKKKIYFPTLRQYLEDQDNSVPYTSKRHKTQHFSEVYEKRKTTPPTKKYKLIQSKKINFYNLETEYAKKIFSPQEQPIYPETVIKNEIIPKIPKKSELYDFIESFTCKNEQINISFLKESSDFVVEFTENELFFGEMVGREKHGKGILIDQKRCFEGVFSSNQRVRGVQTNSAGVYKGEYYQDKREGTGEFEWYNGQYYLGEWKNGKRHGNGLWLNRHGDNYNGVWVNGKGQGYGVYIVQDQKYKGEFIGFRKHGWGKQIFPNGDTYEGSFEDGAPQGKGVYMWANGCVYEGQFSKGLRSGKGVLETNTDLKYEGEFENEKPEGLCQLLLPNGDVYKGSFKDGKKNGRGILTLERVKKILDGYWEDDVFVNSLVY